jgi:hypothetical protein
MSERMVLVEGKAVPFTNVLKEHAGSFFSIEVYTELEKKNCNVQKEERQFTSVSEEIPASIFKPEN